MATRAEALALYRSLVRSSKQFSTYNFREYFLRRTRYAIAADIHRNLVLRLPHTFGSYKKCAESVAWICNRPVGNHTCAWDACIKLHNFVI
jgi:hypothetical protein